MEPIQYFDSKVQYSLDLVKIFHTFGCNFSINLIPDKILMNIMVAVRS